MLRTTFLFWAISALLLAAASANPALAECPEFEAPVAGPPIESGLTLLSEISGIVASRLNPGVFWVHNDSGDSARVFALNASGALLGTYNITGAGAVDWEDIAMGPGPIPGKDYLYIGDIGDNNAVRSSIQVYRILEPDASPSQSPVTVDLAGVEQFTLAYEDGARDAEALFVDPITHDLFIVTKRELKSRVYAADAPLSSAVTNTLAHLGDLDFNFVTAGTISPSGDEIIMKNYFVSFLWPRAEGQSVGDALVNGTPCSILHPTGENQGEAVCFDSTGKHYYTTSEALFGIEPRVRFFERDLPPEPPLPPPPVLDAHGWRRYD